VPQFVDRKAFTVPGTSGQYAPERIVMASPSSATLSPSLLGVTALIESAPASAAIELWLLRVGGDPTNDSDFFLYDSSASSKTWPLASYRGAELRAKSGGTAGSMTVSASAD
jgi:hypothetical protein